MAVVRTILVKQNELHLKRFTIIVCELYLFQKKWPHTVHYKDTRSFKIWMKENINLTKC